MKRPQLVDDYIACAQTTACEDCGMSCCQSEPLKTVANYIVALEDKLKTYEGAT
jgi:hypothetical protein